MEGKLYTETVLARVVIGLLCSPADHCLRSYSVRWPKGSHEVFWSGRRGKSRA